MTKANLPTRTRAAGRALDPGSWEPALPGARGHLPGKLKGANHTVTHAQQEARGKKCTRAMIQTMPSANMQVRVLQTDLRTSMYTGCNCVQATGRPGILLRGRLLR